MTLEKRLSDIFSLLFDFYGPQHWWPGDSPFEVMVGAVLTQSAAWTNVEKAIDNLKAANTLSAATLRKLPTEELAAMIRPSGYYNAKAKKLKALVEWLGKHGDNIQDLASMGTINLREELLGVHGVGPETADSILLYALDKPVFVIDAYTRRIFSRLGVKPAKDTYDDWQRLFMDNLPADKRLFNEYHALIVRLGKEQCRKNPKCTQCCLNKICQYNG
jgi:endonuclease III related protein